jgi:hypothetical protein
MREKTSAMALADDLQRPQSLEVDTESTSINLLWMVAKSESPPGWQKAKENNGLFTMMLTPMNWSDFASWLHISQG